MPGATSDGPFQFQLLTWTGTKYTSYAAAVGQPNTDTGRSGVFTENTCSGPMPPMLHAGWIGNMPSFIMQHQLPGDANGDSKVDINDLSVVLTNYDKSGMSWINGDFNGDGKVDINDLSIVLTNYDKTAGASAAGMAAVPEPASAILLTMLLPGALWRCAAAQGKQTTGETNATRDGISNRDGTGRLWRLVPLSRTTLIGNTLTRARALSILPIPTLRPRGRFGSRPAARSA